MVFLEPPTSYSPPTTPLTPLISEGAARHRGQSRGEEKVERIDVTMQSIIEFSNPPPHPLLSSRLRPFSHGYGLTR